MRILCLGLLEQRTACSPLTGPRSQLPLFPLEVSCPVWPFLVSSPLCPLPRGTSDLGAVPGALWAHPLCGEKRFEGSLSEGWLLL